MEIKQQYITINTKRRSGQKILGVKFIVAHDTGNPGSSAQQNADYYIKSANEMESSAHTFVDDKIVIECIPDTEKAWHVRYSETLDNTLFGFDANDYALSVELCFGGTIDIKRAYENYVEYFAIKCKKFGLDPLRFIGGHFQLDPTRRRDPMTAFAVVGKTWEQFKVDVLYAMKPKVEVISNDEIKKKMHDLIDQIK